ncbi:MAG: TetR/AcrR family transcriptional regulator [Pseudomonadota bacterium]
MADKKQEITDAATRAIRRNGLRSISFRTLADEVGVKSASVHYHFPTKSDLADAVISDYQDKFMAELVRIDARQRGLKGKLSGFAGIFESALADDYLCLCGMLAAELGALGDTSQQRLAGFFQAAERWLENTLRAHAAELDPAHAPRQTALILMAMLEGALLIDRANGNTQRTKAARAFIKTLLR